MRMITLINGCMHVSTKNGICTVYDGVETFLSHLIHRGCNLESVRHVVVLLILKNIMIVSF